MAASELTVTKITGGLSGSTWSGTTPATPAAANVDGNYFSMGRGDAMFIHALNADASPTTVTVVRQQSSSHGLTSSPAVSIPATTGERFIPIDDSFKDSNGRCNLTYSSVTSLTIAVYEIQDLAIQLA